MARHKRTRWNTVGGVTFGKIDEQELLRRKVEEPWNLTEIHASKIRENLSSENEPNAGRVYEKCNLREGG